MRDPVCLPDLDALRAQLSAVEARVWQALVDGDAAADTALLDAEFLGVYPSGFAGQADHAGQLAGGATVAWFTLTGERVKALGQDHALLSYHADFQRVGQAAPEQMYVTSIWRRTDTGWINVFSQDTPVQAT